MLMASVSASTSRSLGAAGQRRRVSLEMIEQNQITHAIAGVLVFGTGVVLSITMALSLSGLLSLSQDEARGPVIHEETAPDTSQFLQRMKEPGPSWFTPEELGITSRAST